MQQRRHPDALWPAAVQPHTLAQAGLRLRLAACKPASQLHAPIYACSPLHAAGPHLCVRASQSLTPPGGSCGDGLS